MFSSLFPNYKRKTFLKKIFNKLMDLKFQVGCIYLGNRKSRIFFSFGLVHIKWKITVQGAPNLFNFMNRYWLFFEIDNNRLESALSFFVSWL